MRDMRGEEKTIGGGRLAYPRHVIWTHIVSYFFGGIFLANSIPHLVSGGAGRPFQTPFAKPPGQGLSSSRVNVLWGGFNLAVGYALLFQVGAFDVRNLVHVGVAFAGGMLISFVSAMYFGRFHGGNEKS